MDFEDPLEPPKLPDLRQMEYRNAVYNRHGTIDCEVNHPRFGWTPFHATPEDDEEHGREIFKRIMAAGKIAPYVAPPHVEPEPTPEEKRIAELEARLAALESRV